MARKKILLIDDEANPDPAVFVVGNYLTYYTVALSEADFDVHVAQTDTEAVDLIRSQGERFDLVVLDLHFPLGTVSAGPSPSNPDDYGGVIVAKWISQNYKLLKVIVVTNVTDPSVSAELEKLESVKFVLFKHLCTPFQLVNIVRRMIC